MIYSISCNFQKKKNIIQPSIIEIYACNHYISLLIDNKGANKLRRYINDALKQLELGQDL